MMTVVAPRAIKKSLLHFPPVILEIWRLLSLVGPFLLNAHRSQWTIPVSERDWRTR